MLERDGRRIEVIDAQVHIWKNEGPDNPWRPEWRGYAHRSGISPTAEGLLEEMDAAGVDRAVLVVPTFGGDEANNEEAGAAAGRCPRRLAVMGRLDITSPQPEAIANWTARPGMLGIRLTFGRGASRHWLTDGTADWFWPAAEKAGLPLMVSCPGHAADLVPVLERHPELRLIVDHAGLPAGQPPGAMERLIEQVFPLARFPGAAVKASAFPYFAGEPYPFPAAQRSTRKLVEAFGAERVFWGTDLTRGLPCSYAAAVRYLAEQGGLEDDHLESVMGKALRDWLTGRNP